MFKTHQAEIENFARKSPENVARVVEFVLTSIQRRFDFVGPMMRKECIINTSEMTKAGIRYAYENAGEMYTALYAPGLSEVDRLMRIIECPGLGLPKAGFVMQLCRGTVGCLDTHNIKNFGLKATAFAISKKSMHLVRKKAEFYVQTCERLGGCEYLWNQWCDFVADKYPKLFANGEHVSREHVDAIIF